MKTVNIGDDVARKIAVLATKRQKNPELLVNEILEQYVMTQSLAQEERGTAFLLSIAGMFDSGPNDNSEQVQTLMTDSILRKYQETLNESTRR
jgi:hypothetical protein